MNISSIISLEKKILKMLPKTLVMNLIRHYNILCIYEYNYYFHLDPSYNLRSYEERGDSGTGGI